MSGWSTPQAVKPGCVATQCALRWASLRVLILQILCAFGRRNVAWHTGAFHCRHHCIVLLMLLAISDPKNLCAGYAGYDNHSDIEYAECEIDWHVTWNLQTDEQSNCCKQGGRIVCSDRECKMDTCLYQVQKRAESTTAYCPCLDMANIQRVDDWYITKIELLLLDDLCFSLLEGHLVSICQSSQSRCPQDLRVVSSVATVAQAGKMSCKL